MNILSISGILPKINDFVFEFSKHYLKEFETDRITFILPVKIVNRFIKSFFEVDPKEEELLHLTTYNYNDFHIHLIRYLSAWRFENLHALLCSTLFYFNKKRIKEIITKNKIEVVHAQFIFPDGLLAYYILKKFGIPYVITSHNEIRYFDHQISKNLAMKIFRNATLITPLNFLNFQAFQKNGLTRLLHIPLGFDEKFLEPRTKKTNTPVKIITVARLIKLKNIDKVILALESLKEKCDFIYNIVGEGPEKENLEMLINKTNLRQKVYLTGKIPHNEIDMVLNDHDIFIMPSYFETFGRVYFEAMALRIPIICARNSGIYGFYKEMEEGISVDHENINDIAGKLEILINDKDLRRTIGNNGHELVKNFTWKNLAVKHHNFYRKAIENAE